MREYTWRNIEFDIKDLSKKIRESGFIPDEIIGIQRGGALPALLISYHFSQAKISSIDSHHYNRGNTPVKVEEIDMHHIAHKRILIVDDIFETGETISAVIKCIEQFNPYLLKTACLVQKVKSSITADYYSLLTHADIIMPWTKPYRND